MDLPSDRTAAILNRISDLARILKTAEETRTLNQIRTDLLLDLLEGKRHQTGAGRAVVNIRVDLATLSGLSEAPGELAGFGPVIADIARQVSDQQQQSEWVDGDRSG